MYLPNAFAVTERATLRAFIGRHGFATLVTAVDEELLVTHVPMLLETGRGDAGTLVGHLARANPHWQVFDGTRRAVAIFHGPHGHVSPAWYTTAPAVPTWNYAVVHATGPIRVVEDEAWLGALVDRMVATYEAGYAEPWPGVLPPDFRARMLRGIVGFELAIERLEGKFKLGQNRGRADQLVVAAHLEATGDPEAQALAALTRAHLTPPDEPAR